ncbi:MAG: adenylate/guanylate cyclase domain-containing protein [Candidatus Cloacimonetes bacterium]|nr:adenylate/guanylate cyclase domain-containing protein [Candidatus Cloacimonadota bacterium]
MKVKKKESIFIRGNQRIENIFKDHRKKEFVIIFSLLFTLIIYLFSLTTFGKELEDKTIDLRFRSFPIPEKADSSIVLISIDDNSLNYFSENGISWPWPRDFYGEIVNYLTAAEAKLVLFDLLFFEKDIERDETDSEYTDNVFAKSLQNAGNVILSAKLTHDQNNIPELSKFYLNIEKNQNFPKFTSGKFPIKEFLNSTCDLGIINIVPDHDGVIRQIPIIYDINDKYLTASALSAYLNIKNTNKVSLKSGEIQINELKIPLTKNNEYFINFYAEGGTKSPFEYYTFSSVMQSALAEKFGSEATLAKNIFKDKIIIIGATGSGIEDFIKTPFANPFPGMEMWATIISNFLNEDFVKKVNLLNFFIIFILNLLTFILFNRFSHNKGLILAFIPILFYTAFVFIFWNYYRILFSLTLPIISFVLVFAFTSLMSFWAEDKAKKEIQKVFTRYLHPDVIKNLLDDPNSIELGGKEIQATVLFTDIADFTTFSENKRAPELIKSLNQYFETLTGFVLKNNGLLDKYTGDGIMAIFGAPLTSKDHAKLACKMAIEHRNFISRIILENPTLSIVDNFHNNTRIGINSGLIVAGNLGSYLRMDYTAIGDDVNLAARLEGVNKIYKTKIIISEATYQMVKDDFICRELDLLKVKGKNEPTNIFELLSENNSENRNEFNWVDDFNTAIGFYRDGNWQKALNLFSQIPVSDYCMKLFIERCEKLLAEKPDNWNPVITLTSK